MAFLIRHRKHPRSHKLELLAHTKVDSWRTEYPVSVLETNEVESLIDNGKIEIDYRLDSPGRC